jgi:hypothetical protein
MHKGTRQAGVERFLELIRTDVETRFQHAAFRRALAAVYEQKAGPGRWSFAVDYALNIQSAVCDFADLLTQAVIARRKKITREDALLILNEALDFAIGLTNWENCAGTFVATSLGITGGEPAKNVDAALRIAFEEEVGKFLFSWRIEAINAIRLRSFLSTARPSSPVTSHDICKSLIARIKSRNPRFSQLQICETLDVNKVPLPTKWQRAGDRTWVEAYNNRKESVKVFLSKIKPSRPNFKKLLD